MSTILPLNNGESGGTIRGKINTNFATLNSTKSETTHTHADLYEPKDSNIQIAVSQTHTHANKSTLDLISEAFTTQLKALYDSIYQTYTNTSVGLKEVPTFVDNGNGTGTFGACNVNLFDNANFSGAIKTYSVSGATLTFANNGSDYVVVDYNGGTPVFRVETDINAINNSSVVIAYRVWRQGNVLHSIDMDTLGVGLANKTAFAISRTDFYKLTTSGGLRISENNRAISITGATVYAGAVEVNVLPFVSTSDVLTLAYHVGGVWTYANHSVYENANLDNGTDLTPIPSNKYATRYFYRSIGDTKQTFYVLGSAYYSSISDAEIELEPDETTLPAILREHSILVGRAIIKQNASSGLTVPFTQKSFASSAVINHNDTKLLQGGSVENNEFYHLTLPIYNALIDLNAQLEQLKTDGTPTFVALKTNRWKPIIVSDKLYITNFNDDDFVQFDTATNKTKFGDLLNSNYSEFETDGTLRFNGSATVWDDVNIATSRLTSGASAPTIANIFGSNIKGYLFDAGTTGTGNELSGAGEELPHDYLEGSNIYPHIHFFNETSIGTTNKTVEFYAEFVWCNRDEVAAVQIVPSVLFTFPDNTLAWTSQRLDLTTLVGTNKKMGSDLSVLIRRSKTVNNTYTGRIFISTVGFHYQKDTLGSRQITTK